MVLKMIKLFAILCVLSLTACAETVQTRPPTETEAVLNGLNEALTTIMVLR